MIRNGGFSLTTAVSVDGQRDVSWASSQPLPCTKGLHHDGVARPAHEICNHDGIPQIDHQAIHGDVWLGELESSSSATAAFQQVADSQSLSCVHYVFQIQTQGTSNVDFTNFSSV
jgi:hypothetical protein